MHNSYLQSQLQFNPFKWNFRMLLQYIGLSFLFQVAFVQFRLHFWIHMVYENILAFYCELQFSVLTSFLFYSAQSNSWLHCRVRLLYEEFCAGRKVKTRVQTCKYSFRLLFKIKVMFSKVQFISSLRPQRYKDYDIQAVSDMPGTREWKISFMKVRDHQLSEFFYCFVM